MDPHLVVTSANQAAIVAKAYSARVVISVSKQSPPPRGQWESFHYRIRDGWKAGDPSPDLIKDAARLAADRMLVGDTVVIHCTAGLSRSMGTAMLAYCYRHHITVLDLLEQRGDVLSSIGMVHYDILDLIIRESGESVDLTD